MTLEMFKLMMRALFILIELNAPGFVATIKSNRLEEDYREFLDSYKIAPNYVCDFDKDK